MRPKSLYDFDLSVRNPSHYPVPTNTWKILQEFSYIVTALVDPMSVTNKIIPIRTDKILFNVCYSTDVTFFLVVGISEITRALPPKIPK